MPVTVLALTTVNPGEQDALAAYVSITGPLLEQAGARIVSRSEVVETVAGDQPPEFVTLIEYPDRKAIRAVFESESYKLAEPVRAQAFSRYDICILS